jgi:hypothetical protein
MSITDSAIVQAVSAALIVVVVVVSVVIAAKAPRPHA